MPKEKIFLSAVSGQFKECRDALRSDLAAVGAEVMVQEDFTQHGGTLLEKLEQYIAACDRVIALVGNACGWEPEPAAAPPDRPARSYTQWEYYFARGERLDGQKAAGKPVHVYFAGPDYLAAHPAEQDPAAARKQSDFIRDIIASGKDRNQFDSLDRLARLVLRDGFKLRDTGRYLVHNLPYDSLGGLFKGREGILAQIRDRLLNTAGEAAAIVAKQALHGLGGVGKSRLAVEYAWRCLPDYSACFFVVADAPQNLERNLAALCHPDILNLPERAAREQEVQVAAVLRWLSRHPGWLLILDNVDSPEAARAVAHRLPGLQSGHVLITSRRTDWDASIRTLPLDTLADEDGTAFLLEKTRALRTPEDTDAQEALALVRTLGGLALAIEQAGAFIGQMRLSIRQYRRRWEQQEEKLRHITVPNYPKSLAVTWETSFAQLTPAARALLNLLCWFAADPIPRGPIQAAFKADSLEALLKDSGSPDPGGREPADLEDLLAELESLSLLEWESGNQSFGIHGLVQEIARSRLSEKERARSLQAALGLVNRTLPAEPPPDDVRSWAVWDPLRPHIAQLVQAADQAGITDPTSRLLNEFGLYLQSKALMREAEPLHRRALAIDEAALGSDHPNVAIDFNNLAQLLYRTNRLQEAEPLLRRALAIDEAAFGIDHPKVAIGLNNLAQLLQETNRMNEAEPLMQRALAIDEAALGSDHPKVAIRLSNLAALLHDTNRLNEAEPLMQRALAIDEAAYGRKHPKVAVDLNNLAQLLYRTNRLQEAEPPMRRALAIDEAVYGSKHPKVATRLNNLAQLLQDTNRQKEAEPLMRRALAIDEAALGSEHPDVARDLNNLAQLLKATNRLQEAEPLMRRALAIDEAAFGSEHPKIAIQLNNLARLLQETTRLKEAEPLSQQAVEILLLFARRTGHEHPHLKTILSNYANLLAEMGHNEPQRQERIAALMESVKNR